MNIPGPPRDLGGYEGYAVTELQFVPQTGVVTKPDKKDQLRHALVDGMGELLALMTQKATYETLIAKGQDLQRKVKELFPK